MGIILRTITGTLKQASGAPIPHGEIKFLLRRNAGYDGIVVPADPVIFTANASGVFSGTLYTLTDAFLPYRCFLPNGQSFKFDLVPGGAITLDALMNLSEITDFDAATIALQNMITDAKARANHTGTQTASTVSDFDAAAKSAAVSDAVYGSGWSGITDVAASKKAVYDKIETLGGGGGGNVATDTLFNAKGDLPVGTGDNTAARLAVGANNAILIADSAEPTGLKYIAAAAYKTLLALVKGDVGLGNVDNTSDVNKPVSTAQQAALDLKQALDSDLTAIAALDASVAGALVTDGAGWIRKTYAQLKTALALVKGDVGLGNVDNTSDANKPVSTAQQAALDLKESTANKDASGGYVGLDVWKIKFRNAANTFTSFLVNSATAARTYTFPDRTGTIADDTDITGAKARANHTGTQTASTVSDFDAAAKAAVVSDAVYGAGWNGVTDVAPSKNAVFDKIETLGGGGGSVATDNIFDAKGDLPVGTADNTGARLAVGANNTILIADSAEATGLKYIAAAAYKTILALVKGDVGLGNVDNTSDANKPVSTAQQTALDLKENTANKDASGGYVGLDVWKIKFRNAANTFTSFLVNSATAARTYTFPDRTGTIADDTDITGAKARANHTGTQTADTVSDFNSAAVSANASAVAAAQAAAQTYADGLVVGLIDDRGNYDASGNTFPATGGSGGSGAVKKGDLWTVSVAGTLGSVPVTTGDLVRALVDTPGQTASNWALTENNIGYVAENAANKDISGGYVGLDVWKIKFRNAANTFTSFLVNSATAARTYTFQDRTGTIADDTDITGAKARTNHTGTQTASTISDFDAAAKAAAVSDAVYGAGWNGITDVAPSKNAVYDKVETLQPRVVTGNTQSGTAYTLVVGDLGLEVRTTNSAAKTVTIPNTATLGAGFKCEIVNLGVGALAFAPGSGVTLRNNIWKYPRYSRIVIENLGTDEYLISAPAPDAVVILTDGATINTDCSLGTRFRVPSIAGDRTLANPTNLVEGLDGFQFTWEFISDATAGRDIALGSMFTFGASPAAFATTGTANAVDYLTTIYNHAASKLRVVATSKGHS